jgi:hypothetical protein
VVFVVMTDCGESHPIGGFTISPESWKGDRVLVEFVRQGTRSLGLVSRPIGRKRWSTWVDGGSTVPLQTDQIVFQFPERFVATTPGPPALLFFKTLEKETSDIVQGARCRPRSLWAAFVNAGGVNLSQAASRLFGSASPMHLYAAFRYCAGHLSYFRFVMVRPLFSFVL